MLRVRQLLFSCSAWRGLQAGSCNIPVSLSTLIDLRPCFCARRALREHHEQPVIDEQYMGRGHEVVALGGHRLRFYGARLHQNVARAHESELAGFA